MIVTLDELKAHLRIQTDDEDALLQSLLAQAQAAAEENYIKPEDVQRLIAFRNNPSDESWMTR